MKIILTSDDRKLGKKNTIIEVKDGYARYLVTAGKALYANESNLKKLKTELEKAKEVDKACRELATKIKSDIEGVEFVIDKPYDEKTQQLHGAITKNDVLKAIQDKFTMYTFKDVSFIDFPKTKLAQFYSAKLKVYDDIIANVTFGIRIG